MHDVPLDHSQLYVYTYIIYIYNTYIYIYIDTAYTRRVLDSLDFVSVREKRRKKLAAHQSPTEPLGVSSVISVRREGGPHLYDSLLPRSPFSRPNPFQCIHLYTLFFLLVFSLLSSEQQIYLSLFPISIDLVSSILVPYYDESNSFPLLCFSFLFESSSVRIRLIPRLLRIFSLLTISNNFSIFFFFLNNVSSTTLDG